MAYCAYCKANILDRHQKCPNCGSTVFRTDDEPVAQPETKAMPNVEYRTVYVEKPVYHTVYVEQPVRVSRSPKSWVATLLLCFFAGIWGFHRFYVGKVSSGLLFMFTCGWCGIGWLVDMIAILTGSFCDQYGLPITRQEDGNATFVE